MFGGCYNLTIAIFFPSEVYGETPVEIIAFAQASWAFGDER